MSASDLWDLVRSRVFGRPTLSSVEVDPQDPPPMPESSVVDDLQRHLQERVSRLEHYERLIDAAQLHRRDHDPLT